MTVSYAIHNKTQTEMWKIFIVKKNNDLNDFNFWSLCNVFFSHAYLI